MSKQSKHTPGPWYVDGPEQTTVLAKHMGIHIATVPIGLLSYIPNGDQTRANAHLIAAAPDAVSLFEDLQEYLSEHGGEAVELLERIDSWLNKATGGA